MKIPGNKGCAVPVALFLLTFLFIFLIISVLSFGSKNYQVKEVIRKDAIQTLEELKEETHPEVEWDKMTAVERHAVSVLAEQLVYKLEYQYNNQRD